jgi:hypothetical protein
MMSDFGKKWTGIMYLFAGGLLMWKAYEALSGAMDMKTSDATAVADATRDAVKPPVDMGGGQGLKPPPGSFGVGTGATPPASTGGQGLKPPPGVWT